MKKIQILGSLIIGMIFIACGDDEMTVITPPPSTMDPEPRVLTIPTTGYSTPASYDGMTLAWADEFDGAELNEEDWNFEIGTGSNGWGNLEEQYYRKENTSIVDGSLVIEAKRELFSASRYTSSRITTQAKQDFQYGRIDIRAVLPSGNGMWPALWMLGSNFSEVGWPRCGEIDIMEVFGAMGSNRVLGTVHWDNAGAYANFGGNTTFTGGNLDNEFHVYSIAWDEEFIRWYLDDQVFHVIDITPADLEEFRAKFFFIFNVAVGGDKGAGDPASTVFPQWMIVDYIRIFQDM